MEKVMLVSRVNYNVSFEYEGNTYVLSPKQKTKREFIKEKLVNINPKEIAIVR